MLNSFVTHGAELIFAGHTHGGQVCVPGLPALVTNCDIPREQAKGLSVWHHARRAAYLNVCAGLGTSIYAPVRFACPPEAVVVTLTARRYRLFLNRFVRRIRPAGHRGVAQLGSALRSGRRGRGFKSRYPDQCKMGSPTGGPFLH